MNQNPHSSLETPSPGSIPPVPGPVPPPAPPDVDDPSPAPDVVPVKEPGMPAPPMHMA